MKKFIILSDHVEIEKLEYNKVVELARSEDTIDNCIFLPS